MSRSIKKGPHIDPKLLRRVLAQNEQGLKEPIKTWSRSCTITPEFVGHTFLVHDGRVHRKCYVNEEMFGHKLGEFSPTRTFLGHSSGRGDKKK